jgi:ABC-type oligopeptide transport system ATPase subunit
MIEVKNLCKTYIPKGKKAVSVKALDNVSLKFPDKGLIFI